jgi:hypothetical protein
MEIGRMDINKGAALCQGESSALLVKYHAPRALWIREAVTYSNLDQ